MKQEKENKRKIPRHVALSYELSPPVSPSLASKTSGAEFSCKQTGRFTSTIPQLPVTLTVAVLRAARPWSYLDTPGGER